jgi:hypothetical protein
LREGRIHLGDAVIGRGKIDAFPERLKQFRETRFVFALARDVAGETADALNHIVADDRMEHAVEVVR